MNIKRLALFVCMALCFALILFVPASGYQKVLAQKILRFHVVANSNSYEDQQLKLQVRDQVTAYLSDKLHGCQTLEESRAVIEKELPSIEQVARECVAASGFDYAVSAAVRERYFPVKTYGEMTFPRGYYEALTIDIGAGAGRNWWCVLFPNLCFTDAVSACVPSDSRHLLENELDEESYAALYEGENVQIRFKLGEIIEDLFSE